MGRGLLPRLHYTDARAEDSGHTIAGRRIGKSTGNRLNSGEVLIVAMGTANRSRDIAKKSDMPRSHCGVPEPDGGQPAARYA